MGRIPILIRKLPKVQTVQCINQIGLKIFSEKNYIRDSFKVNEKNDTTILCTKSKSYFVGRLSSLHFSTGALKEQNKFAFEKSYFFEQTIFSHSKSESIASASEIILWILNLLQSFASCDLISASECNLLKIV